MPKIPSKREFEDAYVRIVRNSPVKSIKGDINILSDRSINDDVKITYLILANEINKNRYEDIEWPLTSEMAWLSQTRELCPLKIEKHLKILAEKGYIEEIG